MSAVTRFVDKCAIALKYLSLKIFTEWSRGEQHKTRLHDFAGAVLQSHPEIQKLCVFFGFSSPYHEYPSWHIVGNLQDGTPFLTQIPLANLHQIGNLTIWDQDSIKVDNVFWEYTYGGALLSMYQQGRGAPLIKMAHSALNTDSDNLDTVLTGLQSGITSALHSWRQNYEREQTYRAGVILNK